MTATFPKYKAPWIPQADWLAVAERVIGGDLVANDSSEKESLLIGLHATNHERAELAVKVLNGEANPTKKFKSDAAERPMLHLSPATKTKPAEAKVTTRPTTTAVEVKPGFSKKGQGTFF